MKKTKQITADNRPICQGCHYCLPMSGANCNACHWGLYNDECKPFKAELHYCEGFKPKEKVVKPIRYPMTEEQRKEHKKAELEIAESKRYENRLKGWNRQQGVK